MPGMNANDPDTDDRRGDDARQRSGELHEHASALLETARRIVHDVRNSRLEAQLLRRMGKR